ncbi:MAG: hypothetical protein ACLPTF_22730 [Steroidobacteraceae bacterium]
MPERYATPIIQRRLALDDALFQHDVVIFDDACSRFVIRRASWPANPGEFSRGAISWHSRKATLRAHLRHRDADAAAVKLPGEKLGKHQPLAIRSSDSGQAGFLT